MRHVVMVAKSDHVHILADYSSSPVIAAMSEVEWGEYYETSVDMAAMRASQPASFAAIATRGAGLWTRDLSGAFVAPSQHEEDARREASRAEQADVVERMFFDDEEAWRALSVSERESRTRAALRVVFRGMGRIVS